MAMLGQLYTEAQNLRRFLQYFQKFHAKDGQ
jgi:hypothetical protein